MRIGVVSDPLVPSRERPTSILDARPRITQNCLVNAGRPQVRHS